jgi:hypothetical protein
MLSGTVDNPVATLQTLNKANDALYERLMELEVSSSERYTECISTFESAYEEHSKRTLEELGNFFIRLRDLESEYHEKLVAAGSELLERVASDHADSLPEDARALLSDKDTCMGVINAAHDARVARLDAKEDELRQLEDSATKAVVRKAVDAEYERNRTRIIEVYKLCQEVHKRELKLERFDD